MDSSVVKILKLTVLPTTFTILSIILKQLLLMPQENLQSIPPFAEFFSKITSLKG